MYKAQNCLAKSGVLLARTCFADRVKNLLYAWIGLYL